MDINHTSISNTNPNKLYVPATAIQSSTPMPKQPDQKEEHAPVPKEVLASADSTATKALAASDLAQTERNKAIVDELLNNRMPVDKQTLQTLIRYALANKEASPLTLVLMYKNNLNLTPTNIRQFEDYQNGTNQLLTDMQKLMGRLSDYINSAMDHNPVPPGDVQGNQHVDTNVVNKVLRINTALLDILYHDAGDNILSQEMSLLQAPDHLSGVKTTVQQQSTAQLSEILQNIPQNSTLFQDAELQAEYQQTLGQQGTNNQSPLQENTLQQIALQHTEAYPDTQQQLTMLQTDLQQDILQQMANQSATPQELAKQTIMQEALQLQTTLPEDTGAFTETLLPPDNSLLSSQGLTLAEVLDPMTRHTLADKLSFLPTMDKLQEVLEKGSIPVKDMLVLLREGLMEASPDETAKLLSSKEYHQILEAAFLHKWTITPERLAKKASISKLLRELNSDLDRLGTLLKAEEQAKEPLPMNESIKKMQDNLQFMKDLNEVFPYLQLPLKLKDQFTHGDLYIMTRKKALSEKKDKLSVLLHLTMKQLGPLNIYLQMDHTLIRADFYAEESATADIVGENLPSLEEMLKQKGYNLQAQVKTNYKKPDFVKDFIEDGHQDNQPKHYTFDIRT